MSGAEEAAAYMQGLLEKLAEFSEPGEGVTRLLYSPEWMQAQQFLLEQIADSGLEGYADDVGNVYGELTGSRNSEPIVLTGSHIDTVVSGGRYDGAYGVAAALAALRHLRRTYGPPQRTITAVSFAEEEGSRFPLTFWGSGHVTGLYDVSEAAGCRDAGGVSLQEAMAGCELGPRQPKPSCSSLAAYVELHIEQGIVLEREGTQLGIVSAICGQRRFAAVVRGTANHAGTTPMGLRCDALAAAAEMTLQLEALATAAGDPLVATVGRLEVRPNTPNVIPGEVRFTLDIRHSDEAELEAFCARALAAFAEIAKRRGAALQIKPQLAAAPAPMDARLQAELAAICAGQGLSWRSMASGAGHDAQLFAPLCPAAMLFVPSRGGISHAPEEYTPPEALAAGLNVLIALLYKLGYEEGSKSRAAGPARSERREGHETV